MLTAGEMEVIANELYEKLGPVFQKKGELLGLLLRKSLLEANMEESELYYSPEFRFILDYIINGISTSIKIGATYIILSEDK